MNNQLLNLLLINEGKVLQTNHKIKSFKLFGKLYTTNFKRKKPYSFDDKSWKVANHSVFWKMTQVATGKVKLLPKKVK